MSIQENFKIIRSKRRTLTLEITADARLVIRAPMRVSLDMINDIVHKKRSWIIEKQKIAQEKHVSVVKRQFVDGEEFLYLGVSYKLRVSPDALRPFQFNGTEFVIAQKFLPRAKRLFQIWYIKQAQEVIVPRVKVYADMLGQGYSSITITSAKKRWGSCTSKKTLNFSWRLIMTPLDMIDYVVAHEVAHLQELNHSSRFWNKVESLMPDYLLRQQWFRDNQHILTF
jgi:predicted metal-dependent hydrolase